MGIFSLTRENDFDIIEKEEKTIKSENEEHYKEDKEEKGNEGDDEKNEERDDEKNEERDDEKDEERDEERDDEKDEERDEEKDEEKENDKKSLFINIVKNDTDIENDTENDTDTENCSDTSDDSISIDYITDKNRFIYLLTVDKIPYGYARSRKNALKKMWNIARNIKMTQLVNSATTNYYFDEKDDGIDLVSLERNFVFFCEKVCYRIECKKVYKFE